MKLLCKLKYAEFVLDQAYVQLFPDTRNTLILFKDLTSLIIPLAFSLWWEVYESVSIPSELRETFHPSSLMGCYHLRFIYLVMCYWFPAPVLISLLPASASTATYNTSQSLTTLQTQKSPFSRHSAWTTMFYSRLDWTTSLFSCIRAYFYFLPPFQIINFPPMRTFIKLLGTPLLYIYLY